MSILGIIRAGRLASRLDPKFVKNVKKLEGIKGDLTPLNLSTIVRRSEVTLTETQREFLLKELEKLDVFPDSNLEFDLKALREIQAQKNPNPRFLENRLLRVDEEIHQMVMLSLLFEQPPITIKEQLKINPFPEGLEVAIPIPESQFNILGKIEEKIKKKPTAPKKQPTKGPVVIDFKSLKPFEPDEPEN